MTSKITDLTTEICTRDDFLESYYQEYYANRAVQILDEKRIFPLTLSNPMLAYLNVLGLYTYLSGSLMAARSTFSGVISERKNRKVPIASDLEENLGIAFNREPKCLRYGENGATYARLLYLMEFPATGNGGTRQSKAQKGTNFPKYLTDIIENYEGMSQAQQSICTKYIRDLVKVYFDTKASVSGHSVRLHLLNQPSEEDVLKQGSLIIKAINLMYPNVDLGPEISTYKPNGKRVSGNISIPLEKVLAFPFRSPIFHVRINVLSPTFSFEHYRFNGASD